MQIKLVDGKLVACSWWTNTLKTALVGGLGSMKARAWCTQHLLLGGSCKLMLRRMAPLSRLLGLRSAKAWQSDPAQGFLEPAGNKPVPLGLVRWVWPAAVSQWWSSCYRWSQLCVPAGICPSLFLQSSFPKVPVLVVPLPISVYHLHIREYEPLFFKSILKIAKHTCGFHLAFSGPFYTLAEWSLVNILVLLVHGWYKTAPLLGAVVQTSWWPGSSC